MTTPTDIARHLGITEDEISEAVYWLQDLTFQDIDPEEIPHLDTEQVLAGVERHYDGGIVQFARDIR